MDCMKDIIEHARSQGNYINYLDVLKYLPVNIVDRDQIDDIIQLLSDMRIVVRMENAEIINFPKGCNDK